VRETLRRRHPFFLLSIIPSCQCFSFTSSSFAAFVVRCTLVTPVYPPQRSRIPCRPFALVGHFWRLLSRRRQHTSATSPDLLNSFLHFYYHCICCSSRCTLYHWLYLSTSNASCYGKQTLQFLPCLSAQQLRRQQVTLHRPCAATDSPGSSRCSALLHCCASAHGAQPPLKDIHALEPALHNLSPRHGHIQQLFARHARCCASLASLNP
jgi:hypothetical protein